MIIYHENMLREAEATKRLFASKLGLPSRLVQGDLGPVVRYTSLGNGSIYAFKQGEFAGIFPDVERIPTLVFTPRDIYDRNYWGRNFKPGSTWLMGYEGCDYEPRKKNLAVVSSARLKGRTGKPVKRATVSDERYIIRMSTSAVQQIVKGEGDHFRKTYYINENDGTREDLGPHCTDSRCLNYAVIDLHAPAEDSGEYLLIKGRKGKQDQKRFDAGNEEQLDRLHEGWFCGDCRESMVHGKMKFDERYYRI